MSPGVLCTIIEDALVVARECPRVMVLCTISLLLGTLQGLIHCLFTGDSCPFHIERVFYCSSMRMEAIRPGV